MHPLCALLGHSRSRKQARQSPATGDWESVCLRCGAAMVRIRHGEWALSEECGDCD